MGKREVIEWRCDLCLTTKYPSHSGVSQSFPPPVFYGSKPDGWVTFLYSGDDMRGDGAEMVCCKAHSDMFRHESHFKNLLRQGVKLL